MDSPIFYIKCRTLNSSAIGLDYTSSQHPGSDKNENQTQTEVTGRLWKRWSLRNDFILFVQADDHMAMNIQQMFGWRFQQRKAHIAPKSALKIRLFWNTAGIPCDALTLLVLTSTCAFPIRRLNVMINTRSEANEQTTNFRWVDWDTATSDIAFWSSGSLKYVLRYFNAVW